MWCRDGAGAEVVQRCTGAAVVVQRGCRGSEEVGQRLCTELVKRWCRGGGAEEVVQRWCRRGGAEVVQEKVQVQSAEVKMCLVGAMISRRGDCAGY